MSEGPALPLDVTAIMRLLPHRYPFLLIDRVTEFGGETCRAIKNVTINEPFFVGHFPGHPVMPGVLILEAMAQTAAVHACLKLGKQAGEQAFYLVSMDKARFRKPVVPGDQLVLTTSLLRGRGRIWKFRGEVHVAGLRVVLGELEPPGARVVRGRRAAAQRVSGGPRA